MVSCWCLIIEAWNRKKRDIYGTSQPCYQSSSIKSTQKIPKKTTRPFCYDLLGRLPGLCWPPVGLYEIRGVVGFVADLNPNHSESNPTLIILIAWIWPVADLWSIHKMFLLNYFMILHATWSIHDLFARHQSMQDPACFPHRDRQWFVIFGVPYYPGLVSDLLTISLTMMPGFGIPSLIYWMYTTMATFFINQLVGHQNFIWSMYNYKTIICEILHHQK